MREIGEGHTALSTFCGLMNLPSPMQSKAFNEMQENLSEAYKQVADVSMQNTANEFRFSEAEREIDLDVTVVMMIEYLILLYLGMDRGKKGVTLHSTVLSQLLPVTQLNV